MKAKQLKSIIFSTSRSKLFLTQNYLIILINQKLPKHGSLDPVVKEIRSLDVL